MEENYLGGKSVYSISIENTGMGMERVESPRCQYIIMQFFTSFIPFE